MSNACVCGTSKSNLECTFIIYRHEESLEWHHATAQRLFEENIWKTLLSSASYEVIVHFYIEERIKLYL